jgi:hypothetical protein
MTMEEREQIALAGGKTVNDHRWLKWGVLVVAADVVVHNVAARLANPWEAWSTFLENFVFIAVTGLVLASLSFGVLVRWGLRDSTRGTDRAATAAAIAGGLSVLSYAAYFMWAPFVVGPAAVLLARTALAESALSRRGRHLAKAGMVLGATSCAAWVAAVLFALATGHFPFEA